MLFFLYSLSFSVGILAQLQMPQTNMDVTKGKMVVLTASYNSVPGSDLSTNTILWNLVTNNTQLVRNKWTIWKMLSFSCERWCILSYIEYVKVKQVFKLL